MMLPTTPHFLSPSNNLATVTQYYLPEMCTLLHNIYLFIVIYVFILIFFPFVNEKSWRKY